MVSAEVPEGKAVQGREPCLHLHSLKTEASRVVRSQGGLSEGVLGGKRHLKIAQDDGVGKPSREMAGVTYGAGFSPANP